jgi:hypothetical protein
VVKKPGDFRNMSFSFGGELEDFNGFQWISALK